MITKSEYEVRSADMLTYRGCAKLYKTDNITLKKEVNSQSYEGEAPQYLVDLFKTKICRRSLLLCNSENKLKLQKPRTKCFKGSFSYSGAVLLNSLPAETRAHVMTPLE